MSLNRVKKLILNGKHTGKCHVFFNNKLLEIILCNFLSVQLQYLFLSGYQGCFFFLDNLKKLSLPNLKKLSFIYNQKTNPHTRRSSK